MYTGFVYKWTYKPTKEYYIGVHKGTTSDGYIGSGSRFRKKWALTNPSNWIRDILFEGQYKDCLSTERKLVTSQTLDDPLCLNMVKGGSYGAWGSGYSSKPFSYRTKPQQVTVNGITFQSRMDAIKALNITFEELDSKLIKLGWYKNCKYNHNNRY